MAQPVALFIPDDVVSEVAAIAAPSDAKSGVEQLRKLLDTKGLDPVAARIWAAQGWTLAHGRHMAAVGKGDKAAAKAAAALEEAFLRLHNDLLGRGFFGRAFGSAKEPFVETLRLAAQRREEQSAAAAERSAKAAERQADAAERSAKAAEQTAAAAERQANAAVQTAAAVEKIRAMFDAGSEDCVETLKAVGAASKAMVSLANAEAKAAAEAAKAKAEAPATP